MKTEKCLFMRYVSLSCNLETIKVKIHFFLSTNFLTITYSISIGKVRVNKTNNFEI